MTLKNFNQNELVGLDNLKSEIDFVFCDTDSEVGTNIYENILKSVLGCKDLFTAQKNVDFGIKILHLYADLKYLIAHIIAGTDFIEIRKSIFKDEFLDNIGFKESK